MLIGLEGRAHVLARGLVFELRHEAPVHSCSAAHTTGWRRRCTRHACRLPLCPATRQHDDRARGSQPVAGMVSCVLITGLCVALGWQPRSVRGPDRQLTGRSNPVRTGAGGAGSCPPVDVAA
jgi:hypothetical protein